MRGNTRILLGSILLFAVLNQVEAATITWTNTAGGNWSDAANWSPKPGVGKWFR